MANQSDSSPIGHLEGSLVHGQASTARTVGSPPVTRCGVGTHCRQAIAGTECFCTGQQTLMFFDEQALAKKTSVMTPLPFDRFLCGFAHIFAGGYSAGWYLTLHLPLHSASGVPVSKFASCALQIASFDSYGTAVLSLASKSLASSCPG